MLSLRNLCLQLIAEEFERFHLAITAANDANFKRNFEFLQKMYSSELAKELFERKKLKDEYLEFLINEHLNIFNENWLRNSRYQNSIKDILCRLPNLIKISCIQTNDEILENIAKFCPKIVEIDGIRSSVTDQGVEYLCKKENGSVPCPELRNLFIPSDSVTEKALEDLIRNVKSLEKLDHEKVPLVLYSLYKADLRKLDKIPSYNLVALDLLDITDSLSHYNDLLKICLTLCPKLKCLNCSISNKEQLNFFNNICLEVLGIFYSEGDPEINIDSFLKNSGRNLTKLGVQSCIMSVSELAVSCPKLKFLEISNITFSDDHGDLKSIFPSLVSCTYLEGDDTMNDKTMGLILLSSPKLEQVNFYYCDFSQDMKTYILMYCEKHILKSISFTQCMIHEENFVKNILLCCPSLETMFIDSCPYIEEDELVQLAETLPNKPRIEVYDP